MSHGLSHLDDSGNARMVDVSGKPETARQAEAAAEIRMARATLDAVVHGSGPKGEVLATARIAGIQAAKRTHEMIPMCHPLLISSVTVDFTALRPDETGRPGVEARATVRCQGATGVEMEALHAVSVAALTIYDMAKALEKGMEITSIRLLSKSGGKTGDWTR